MSHLACHLPSPVNSTHPLIITRYSRNSTSSHHLAHHPSFAHSVVSALSTSSLLNLTSKHPHFSPIPQQTTMISCLHTIPLCQTSSINTLQSLLSSKLMQKIHGSILFSSSQIITPPSRTSIQTIGRPRHSQETQNIDQQIPQPTSFSQKTLPIISCSFKFVQPSKSLENC